MNPIAAGLLGGFLGFGLHAIATPKEPLFSKVWGGAPIPLSPIFVIAGSAIALTAPQLQSFSLAERALVYGSAATALELASCAVDRKVLNAEGGKPAWSYSSKSSNENLLGCVDLKHSLVWTLLALGFEQIVKTNPA